MVLVKATEDSELGFVPTADMKQSMAEMEKFNEELIRAGIMQDGDCDGLKPTSEGKRVVFDGPARTVMEGPFKNARDQVAGFWLWDVEDMNEAVAWVKRCPNPMPGPSEIEIRPLYEMEDLEG